MSWVGINTKKLLAVKMSFKIGVLTTFSHIVPNGTTIDLYLQNNTKHDEF